MDVESTHLDAIDTIKEELTKTPVLIYFNPMSAQVIQTDASLKGLGTGVLQEVSPAIYVSRSTYISLQDTKLTWSTSGDRTTQYSGCIEKRRSTQPRISGYKADGCNSGASNY